jgi:DNA-directed RNA polymerase specialized sigma24 family protein
MPAQKKKPEHYVNNKEFYAALVEYKRKCLEAEAAGRITPRIPDYIGMCIYKIANRLSNRPNFINYTYKDEMISDGIEVSIANIKSFNPDKYDNPFAYFTQIIYHAFIHRIQKEKKQQYLKYKSLEQAIISNDQHTFQDSDDRNISYSNYNEAAIL